jgi:hypothetical protein
MVVALVEQLALQVNGRKADNVRGGGMGGVIQPKNNHAEESGDTASKYSR